VTMQIPANTVAGFYPIEVVVGDPPGPVAHLTVFGATDIFTIDLSPAMLHTAPGDIVETTVNIQSVGTSSAIVGLRVDGPPDIQWRFDGGELNSSANVSPPIGSTIMSSLEIQSKASTPMGHYSLAVKAVSGNQTEMRNLELDVGAAAGYDMPIFSLTASRSAAPTFPRAPMLPASPLAATTSPCPSLLPPRPTAHSRGRLPFPAPWVGSLPPPEPIW